jgi:hypothetical protein
VYWCLAALFVVFLMNAHQQSTHSDHLQQYAFESCYVPAAAAATAALAGWWWAKGKVSFTV